MFVIPRATLATAIAAAALLPVPAGALQDGIFDCSRSDQPCYPGGSTAPGCTCHGGLLPNDTTTQLLVDGLPEEGYRSGETYAVTVWVLGAAVPDVLSGCPLVPGAVNGFNNFAGFSLSVSAGILSRIDPQDGSVRIRNQTECQRLRTLTNCGTPLTEPCPPCDDVAIVDSQATHTLEGNKQFSWRVGWTAPDPATGPVTFHLAGNVVNGNCRPDSGDLWSIAPAGTFVVAPAP